MKKFTFYKQSTKMGCGPTCLMMVAKHYGKCLSQDLILDILKVTRKGVSLLAIGNAAKKVGFCTMALRAKPKYLKKVNLPIIIYWNQNHFVVLFK